MCKLHAKHAKQIDMTFSDMTVIPNCSTKLQAIETQSKGNNNLIAGKQTVNSVITSSNFSVAQFEDKIRKHFEIYNL